MRANPTENLGEDAGGAVRVEAAAIALAGDLVIGVAANAAACIAAGLAAASPGWAGRPLADAAGVATASSSHLPIAILRAEPAQLAGLLERARERAGRGALVVFPRFAQRMHTAEEYWAEHARRSLADEALLGLGLAGTRTWIRSLTGALPLLR